MPAQLVTLRVTSAPPSSCLPSSWEPSGAHPPSPSENQHELPACHGEDPQKPVGSRCLKPPGPPTFLGARRCNKVYQSLSDSEDDELLTRKTKIPSPLSFKPMEALMKAIEKKTPLALTAFIKSDSNLSVSGSDVSVASRQPPHPSPAPWPREFGGEPYKWKQTSVLQNISGRYKETPCIGTS